MELEEFTKAEIISWVRQQPSFCIHPPKKSALLFIRWQVKSQALQEKRRVNSAALQAIDGKKRDEYAKQCNATTDLNKKLVLLKKMKPFHHKMAAYIAESNKLNAEGERVQKIYDQIDIERQKE